MLTFKSKKPTNETPKSILNSQEGRKNPFKVLHVTDDYFVIIAFFIRNVTLHATSGLTYLWLVKLSRKLRD